MNKLWRNIALCLLIIALFVMPISAVENTEVTKDSVLEEPNVNASRQKDEGCRTDIISFSQPLLSVKGDYINVDIAESTSSTMGKDTPALPIVTKTYTLPFNTQIKDVEISYSNNKKEILTKPIISAPEPQMHSLPYNSKEIFINEITETYNDLDIYPEQRYNYRTGAGLKDGQRMKFLTVHLYPIQYSPKDSMIYYSDSATIHITSLPPENPLSFPDVYDLLIITPAGFTDELQPLVDYKNMNEIPTIMVTLDDIPDKGVDQQESIKYFIKDSIETWGIIYVILVGSGVEGEEKFPVRYAYCSPFYSKYPEPILEFPSDLYYADIYHGDGSFSTWNCDDDDRYFEYPTDLSAVDIYPDVYLSRLPCNNAYEVTIVVDKIINYMENNEMTHRVLQIGGDNYILNESVCEGEFTNEEVLKKLPGYTTIRLWSSLGNLKKLNIRQGFMDGVDFVDLSGHGYSTSFGTHPPNDPTTFLPPRSLISPYPGFLSFDYDLFFFNNAEKLPVVVYSACLCSRFTEVPNCLGWKTLSRSKGGGIASFGYTTSTWGLVGSEATERYTNWNEVKIFEEMYNNKILGMCWGNCITDYLNSFKIDGFDLVVIPSFALFGDPSLAIEDVKNSKIKSASESIVWSDNFDSYNLMQVLDGTPDDGGWNTYLNNPERGAYVVDDYARSPPHSLKIYYPPQIIHEFNGITSGRVIFRDWVYVPSGSDFGESCIGFLSYYFPDHYVTHFIESSCYWQVIITFDVNNGVVKNRAHTESLPLILDTWVELRFEIDLELDWVECFYDDELLVGQKWTYGWSHVEGFLNFAGVVIKGYLEEDFYVYHDDMSLEHERTGLKPDLQCDGSLSLTCTGGETVSDTFTVRNIGDPGSRLEWIIYDAPEYGTDSRWQFDPLFGKLTPEDGELTVTATLTAPNKIGEHTGVIKIHAVGDHSDSCEIPITLTVKKSKELRSPLQLWLENHPHLFPILRALLDLI